MTIYRNANWTRRNYDCTNVVFQIVPEGREPHRMNGQKAPAGEWVKAEAIPGNMESLGGFAGHSFFGFM